MGAERRSDEASTGGEPDPVGGAPLGCSRVSTAEMRRHAVLDVMSSLRADVGAPWTLRAMASRANMSPYHFNRVFASIVGIPPRRFLAALRIDTAKRLLMTTERSVTEICFEVGYESLGTFTTRFTEVVGATPGRVKQLRRTLVAESLDHPSMPPEPPPSPGAGSAEIAGTVAGRCSGTVFVGVFPGRIPQGRPHACAILDGPGPYRAGPLAEGSYFVHAFAPPAAGSRDGETADGEAMIGSSAREITLDRCGAVGSVDIDLRELTTLDPPILIELSLVLRELQESHRVGLQSAPPTDATLAGTG